jgi:hypothetical protein
MAPIPTIRRTLLVAALLGCGGPSAAGPFKRIGVIPADAYAVCLEGTADEPEIAIHVPPCVCPRGSDCRVDASEDGALDLHPRLEDAACDACLTAAVRCALPPATDRGAVRVRIDGRDAFVLDASGGRWGPVDACWIVPPEFDPVRFGPIGDPGREAAGLLRPPAGGSGESGPVPVLSALRCRW